MYEHSRCSAILASEHGSLHLAWSGTVRLHRHRSSCLPRAAPDPTALSADVACSRYLHPPPKEEKEKTKEKEGEGRRRKEEEETHRSRDCSVIGGINARTVQYRHNTAPAYAAALPPTPWARRCDST